MELDHSYEITLKGNKNKLQGYLCANDVESGVLYLLTKSGQDWKALAVFLDSIQESSGCDSKIPLRLLLVPFGWDHLASLGDIFLCVAGGKRRKLEEIGGHSVSLCHWISFLNTFFLPSLEQ